MGRIYIDFGEPVVLDKAPSGEDSLALAKIALQVGVEANRVTPITLASLISMTLLGAAPRALTREEMQLELDQLSEWAQQRNIRMSSDFDRENAAHTTALTQILVDSGLITRYDAGPEVVYGITADQHAVAGYYRNTIIHHFLTKAIAELALLYTSAQTIESSELFWQEAEHIRDLFKFEFFYAPSDQFKQEVREELNRYRPDWEQQLDQQQESALNLLVSFEPHVAHATLLPYVEGYRVVSDVLARLDEDQSLTEKNCISQSLAYGTQAYLQRRITSEASIGKLLFENGYKLIVNLGLAEAGTENLAERRKSLSQEFRRLAHRLDRIRAIALPNPYQD
jgi:glycerol-3-phosphate O-acyltransferase